MAEVIQLGEVSIELTRRAVKHAHLVVHPPAGRVTLVAPPRMRLEVARAYATAKAAMILWGMGVSQHVHGTDNVRCLIAL